CPRACCKKRASAASSASVKPFEELELHDPPQPRDQRTDARGGSGHVGGKPRLSRSARRRASDDRGAVMNSCAALRKTLREQPPNRAAPAGLGGAGEPHRFGASRLAMGPR